MKKLLLTLLCLNSFAQTALAQGEVFFANRIPGLIDARVSAGWGGFADSTYNADLAVLRNGSWESIPGSTTPFRGTPGSAANGYITGFNVSVPGLVRGTEVSLRMRGFLGATFEEGASMCVAGESDIIQVTLGGGTIPVPNLVGLESFGIFPCPEPSTLALGLLGAAVPLLAWWLRK